MASFGFNSINLYLLVRCLFSAVVCLFVCLRQGLNIQAGLKITGKSRVNLEFVSFVYIQMQKLYFHSQIYCLLLLKSPKSLVNLFTQ